MWRLAYDVVSWLLLPVVIVRLMWRGVRNPRYRERWQERFGFVPRTVPRGAVWFHAVSAGEVAAAAPVVTRLKKRVDLQPLVVTTTTPAGADAVARLLGEDVAHCYAPYDFRWAVARFLRVLEPRLLVIFERELWPNIVELTARRGIEVLLVNARLSPRSAERYRLVAPLVRRMLGELSWIACQFPDDARRLEALGAPVERVDVVGSVKFDADLPEALMRRARELRETWALGERFVWIAASTHSGEEAIALAAHRRLLARHPGLLLVLAPRHAERFGAVAQLVRARGFRSAARTECLCVGDVDVLVVNTMGELHVFYSLAHVAFVGGTLVPVGGHNVIEAALHGMPLVIGPHDFNVAAVAAAFQAAGCLHRVVDEESLAAAVTSLLEDPERRAWEGSLARAVIAAHRGATARVLERVAASMP